MIRSRRKRCVRNVRWIAFLMFSVAYAGPEPQRGIEDDAPALFSVGFEEVEAANLWTAKPLGGAEASIRLEAGAGKGRSLRVEKTNVKGYVQWETVPIPVETATTYRVSAWLNTLHSDRKSKDGTTTAAAVYFMISPSSSKKTGASHSNIFGPTRPFFSSGSQWEKLDMSFTTGPDIDRVRISLVFAQDAIDILMDDLKLTRLGNKKDYKPRYERPVPETLMPLEEAKKIVATRPRATAEVRRVGQRPRLFLDGKESFPDFYVGNAWRAQNSQVREFGMAGVKVTFIPYILGRGVYGPFGVWRGPGQTDFSEVDEMLWRVLRADPNMYIMFYLCTDPYPEWAAENNLEDVVTDRDGNKAIVNMHFLRWDKAPPPKPDAQKSPYIERYGYVYASERLRKDTGEVLRQFAGHIRNSLPGKAVIGYHVIGGNDGQMFQWNDFHGNRCGDYSPASLRAFRNWLRTKYRRETELKKAWRQPNVTFETAEFPVPERIGTDRLLLDRPEDRDIVDYKIFRSEGTIDTLAGYGQILRDTHKSPILIGTYYAGPAASVISHRATGYLLKKNMFNYVTSVLTYDAIRWPGGTGKAHQAWSSLLLHDTFGLSEADFRSWKTYPGTPENNYHVARVETEAESSAMIRRDAGHMLAVGQGIWWYDMSGGWFSAPAIMRTITETVNGFRADLKNPALPRSDVAVFIDERSLSHVASANAAYLDYAGINRQIVLLNSSGVPYHLYLQEDVANRRLPPYKLYLFLNPYHLSDKEWNAIRSLRRDGRMLAFVHAPGIVAGSIPEATDAADAVTRITGIHVKNGGEQSLQLHTLPGNGIMETPINQINLKAPVFAVDDPEAKPVAAYADGQIAVAFKDFGKWKSLFFGGVSMNEFFLNALAHYAGAWVAAPAGNAVYGSQNFLTIHALYPGNKEVRLLERSEVTDLATGELISRDTDRLTFPMKRGETRWFHLQPPAKP